VSYLLDTNACIAIINRRPEHVRARYEAVTASGVRACVSSIAAFELWYGVAKSSLVEENRKRLKDFLRGPIILLPFDDEDADAAGAIRVELEAQGRPIGAYDVLIAGQALRRRMTLVTSNFKEFARVKGLRWENWAA